MSDDIIGDVLDLNPLPKDDKLPVVRDTAPVLDTQVERDAEYVRQNLYDLIEKGHGAIDNLLTLADQSQNARTYEVLGGMIKTLVDTNKDLLDFHQQKNKLVEPEKPAATNNVQQNLFVGSTGELLKLLKKDE